MNCSSRACSFLPAIEPWVDPSIERVRQWLFRSLFSNVHSATDHGQYGKVTLSWNSQTYTLSYLEQWFFFHKNSNMSFNCLSRVTLRYCPYRSLDTLFSFRSSRAPLLCSLWRQYLQSLSILQRAVVGIIYIGRNLYIIKGLITITKQTETYQHEKSPLVSNIQSLLLNCHYNFDMKCYHASAITKESFVSWRPHPGQYISNSRCQY